jgi:hypothetical protein
LKRSLLKKPRIDAYYEDSDLQIGSEIDVFGRTFLLYDADEFTKSFLDQKYGRHNWTPIDVDNLFAQKTSPRLAPPYNGWGDEADSLGYVYSLHPKPPRKDIVKLLGNDGMVLRFCAKFKNPLPQDARREFVIIYYLADDTVAVFERQHRNSGFRGGKFIQRGKWKNASAGNRNFLAADFKVGEVITINGFSFVTGIADEYALSFMESQAPEFPQADLADIVRVCAARIDRLRRAFEAIDPELSGWVPPPAAEAALADAVGLPPHEALTVVRRWTSARGFDYFSFISALA